MSNYSVANKVSESSQPREDGARNSIAAAPISQGEFDSEKLNDSQSAPTLPKELADAWLTWQCQMVAGVIRAAVFLPNEIELNCSAAIWPAEGNCEPQLIAAATQACLKNGGVKFSKIGYGPDHKRICDLVASPILFGDTPVAFVAFAISIRSEPQQHAVLQLLRWGGLWVETLIREKREHENHSSAIPQKIVSGALAQSSLQASAIEAVNQLVNHFACERVSLGFRKGPLIRLEALSHVSRFDSRTQFVRAIENAMEESLDQDSTVVQPDTSEEKLRENRRAHSELAANHGGGAVCTIPLRGVSAQIGAIALERSANHPFEQLEILQLELLARQLALILELKRKDERSVWQRNRDSLFLAAGSVIGPGYLRLKLFSMAMVAFLAVSSLIDGTYAVRSPASIEGTVRQLLVASQNGYIKQAVVRAGDDVKQGQLLATLDDRNLQLELQKWQGERNQIEKKYLDALATGDRTEVGINKARLDQVDAEIELTNNNLIQTELKAPFDGVVVSGDLSQSLGAPVEIGQLMFEIAPLENYRVVLEVDEHSVDGIEVGKSGRMIVAALPRSTFEFSVNQIVPLAVNGTSNTYFRVEASLDNPSELLRPGMRGIAKVELGERNLLWIWTHKLIDRIRLWAWYLGL